MCKNVRWVDEGDVVCSAGVSAGIDMAFHILRGSTEPSMPQAWHGHGI